MSNSKNPNGKYNESSCRDITAYSAVENIRREERYKLITKLQLLAKQYGYKIVGQVKLKELEDNEN